MMKNKTPFFYRVCRGVLGPIFRFYYRPKIINKEYIPKEGAFLIVGDHRHLYDQNLTIISTKRYLRYMAKKEYRDDKRVAWFFKWNGCIFVDRSKKDPESKKAALDTLAAGGAVGLFPEGTRNKTDAFLLPFKYGAVSMAQKADVPIVPFGITGDYKFRTKNLVIRYGKPFKVTGMDLEEANKKLFNTVKELMEENLKESNEK